jgi:hypothetical protein
MVADRNQGRFAFPRPPATGGDPDLTSARDERPTSMLSTGPFDLAATAAICSTRFATSEGEVARPCRPTARCRTSSATQLAALVLVAMLRKRSSGVFSLSPSANQPPNSPAHAAPSPLDDRAARHRCSRRLGGRLRGANSTYQDATFGERYCQLAWVRRKLTTSKTAACLNRQRST